MEKLIGDKNNGVSISYVRNNILDEVFLYVDGEVRLHLEMLNDDHYWLGIYPKNNPQVMVDLGSKTEIEAIAEADE